MKKIVLITFILLITILVLFYSPGKELVTGVEHFVGENNSWVVDYEYDHNRYLESHTNFITFTAKSTEPTDLDDLKFRITSSDAIISGIISETDYKRSINDKNQEVFRVLIGSLNLETYTNDIFTIEMITISSEKSQSIRMMRLKK